MDAQAYNQGRCVRGDTNLKLHSKTLMIWKHCFPVSLLCTPSWWYVAHCNIVLGLWTCFDDLLHRRIFSCACIVVSCVRTQGAIGFKATFHKKTLALSWTWRVQTWWLLPGGPVLTSSFFPWWHTLKFLRIMNGIVMLRCCFASDSSIMHIYIFKY